MNISENFYKVPNDLHYAVLDVYEFTVLSYLLRLHNGSESNPYPSQFKMRTVCKIGNSKLNSVLAHLEDRGLIIRIPQKRNTTTQYVINSEAILSEIRHNTPTAEASELARREYSERQKDAMALKRIISKPELAHKAETIMGNTVSKDGGVIVAQPKETGLINFESEDK